MRTPIPPDPERQLQGLQDLAQDPPMPDAGDVRPAGQNSLLVRRTRIGSYAR